MKWKECQEVLKMNKKFFATRYRWPPGIRIFLENSEEGVLTIRLDIAANEEYGDDEIKRIIERDLVASEDKSYDWGVY